MPTVGLTATAGDWQTGYETTEGPADLVLDGLRYKPREGSTNGTITEYEIPANPFTDVPDGTFYYDPVLWAVGNGITTGATATTFNPDLSASVPRLSPSCTALWLDIPQNLRKGGHQVALFCAIAANDTFLCFVFC